MAKSAKETPPLPGLAMDALSIGWVEKEAIAIGYSWILGVDEVGRGPLAGPVTTAGVLVSLRDLAWCNGLNDSKKLSPRARERWVDVIEARAHAHEVVHIEAPDVDRLNVLAASLQGMTQCAEALVARAGIPKEAILVVVDGKQRLPEWDGAQKAIVRGDASSWAIAAASILAKVRRDARMTELDAVFPGYGFGKHAGYGTKQHLEALQKLGVTSEHRTSFSPVRAILQKNAEDHETNRES